MSIPRTAVSASLLALGLVSTELTRAADWPQFLGPDRNGISTETDLIEKFGDDGPEIVWSIAPGAGMSGLAVADNAVYTLVQRDGRQFAIALDAASGNELWASPVAPAYKNSMGDGPRAAPAVAGNSVFVFTGEGVLASLNTEDGSINWSHDVVDEHRGEPADYGMACSPLLVENLVIVTVGAPDATVAAYDQSTGEPAWTAGKDHPAGYSSPVLLEIAEQSQIVVFSGNALLGVDPAKGEVLWQYPYETDFNCNIATPVSIDGNVFISCGENHGCALLSIKPDGDGFSVEEVWTSLGRSSIFRNEWQTSVLLDGKLYGFDNVGSAGPVTHLACIDAATGEREWQELRFGKGNLIAADGKLWITNMDGELIIVRATPDGFEELDRAQILNSTRQAPALANGRLYLRGNENIVCIDINN
ncbi:MAG: alcohol dehydrogenase [Planctomycetota bacterium]|nr:MAG: alcohol dehydrogenase [Planctomycetota bacterium]REJ87020.1 MAG: alcohol dehydrogenase [Planctomycetota bacterium]REK21681.1 MAG: alcohol dehydrogenase [Planctomycetota bacterium]REK32757.1 MAG: alcohol dehydrogenase [Planctomycetota bacterium]